MTNIKLGDLGMITSREASLLLLLMIFIFYFRTYSTFSLVHKIPVMNLWTSSQQMQTHLVHSNVQLMRKLYIMRHSGEGLCLKLWLWRDSGWIKLLKPEDLRSSAQIWGFYNRNCDNNSSDRSLPMTLQNWCLHKHSDSLHKLHKVSSCGDWLKQIKQFQHQINRFHESYISTDKTFYYFNGRCKKKSKRK